MYGAAQQGESFEHAGGPAGRLSAAPARGSIPGVLIAAACYAVAAGALTLAGWALGVQGLTDWAGSGISMFPNTAVAALLAGAALLLLPMGHTRAGAALGALVCLIGAATLFEHLSGVNLGIDALLLSHDWGQRAAAAPGRMGPPASTSFVIIGAAIVLSTLGRGGRRGAAVGGMLAIGIAALSIVGYLFGAGTLYSLPRLTGIAVQTSTVLLALGIGLVVRAEDVEPMRTLRGDSAASVLVRRMLPLVVLLPILIGWLRVRGEGAGLYDSAFGTALRTLIEVALAAALLWWAAGTVGAHERALRQSEADLRRQSGQLAAFLETAAIGLHRVGPDGTILWANDAELRTLGYAREEYIGRPIAQFHDDQGVIAGILARLHAGERVSGLEAQMRCKDGSIKTVLIDASVFRESGRFVHTQSFTRDITDRKQAEAALVAHRLLLEQRVLERTSELVAAQDRLRVADRMAAVGTLAAGLAHDMRNVLLPLGMRLDMVLTAPGLTADATTDLAVVCALLDHLRAMANNLSLFARDPEQEGTEGRTEPARWCQQVRGFIDASSGASVVIKWDIPDGLPAIAIAPHRLTQAVLNLVHNARDAIAAARGPLTATPGVGRITVEARPADPSAPPGIVLRVSDDGCGMSEEVQRRCREPFFTTKDRPTAAGGSGGTGLGLSLAHAIVERVGGTMDIWSQPGKGTTVTLNLPIAAPATSATGRGTARVSIEDKRTRAIVGKMLGTLRYEVLESDAPGSAGPDGTLWVTDGHGITPEDAASFIRGGPGRRVVALWDAAAPQNGSAPGSAWHAAGVELCSPSLPATRLRAILAGDAGVASQGP